MEEFGTGLYTVQSVDGGPHATPSLGAARACRGRAPGDWIVMSGEPAGPAASRRPR